MSVENVSKSAYDNVNVEATIERLVEKLGRKELVEDQINAKIQKLEGFVTRIGAMQLVARERGVEIVWKQEPLDLTKIRRITLKELSLELRKEVVEVDVVITRASEVKVSSNGRNYQFFTIDDGDTSRDLIVFGQTKCGMFASWVGERILIRPLKVGEYKGEPQLQVVDETEIGPDEPAEASP